MHIVSVSLPHDYAFGVSAYPPEVRAVYLEASAALRFGTSRQRHTCQECGCSIDAGDGAWRLDYHGVHRSRRWCRWCVDTRIIEGLLKRAERTEAAREKVLERRAATITRQQQTIASLHVALGALGGDDNGDEHGNEDDDEDGG